MCGITVFSSPCVLPLHDVDLDRWNEDDTRSDLCPAHRIPDTFSTLQHVEIVLEWFILRVYQQTRRINNVF